MVNKHINCDFWLDKDLYDAIMHHGKIMIKNNDICKEYAINHSEIECFQIFFQDFLFKYGYHITSYLEDKYNE